MSPVPLRWVLIRDPQETFPPQALLSTDLEACPKQIIGWFILRWQLEMCQPHYPHTTSHAPGYAA